MLIQFFKYISVGVINTALFGAVCWLGDTWKWHYSAYTLAGYCIAVLFSFTANFTFTFQSKQGKCRSMAKFIFVSLSLILLTQLIQKLLIDLLGVYVIIGILIGMIFYTVTGFCLNKYWVFDN